eukprot:8588608-Ditylum_brightwellii.AAC.1
MAPVLHHFDDHSQCTPNCPARIAAEKEEQYHARNNFLCKKMHSDIFEDVSSVLNKFTSKSQLKEILHGVSTQRNEGTNNNTNTKAPKTCVYSSTSSLQDRVATMVGEHNLGHSNYYA